MENARKPGFDLLPAPGSEAAGDVERRVRVLEGQNRILETMARNAPIEHVAHTFVEVMQDLFGNAGIAFFTVNAETARLHLVAANLPPAWHRDLKSPEISDNDDVTVAALRRREAILIDDSTGDPQWADTRAALRAAGFSACLSQPILDAGGSALGVVNLYLRDATPPDTLDFTIIDTLVPVARIVIERDRRAQDLVSADERLLSLAESIPGVVYQRAVRPDGDVRYTYISEGAFELFGVSAEEIIANPDVLFDCHDPEYKQDFRDRMLKASQEMAQWDIEAPITTRQGKRKWTHAIARPTRRADGTVVWNGIILDATRLKVANLELTAASRAKSEFLANMSHELRTPLNAIIGFSELMLVAGDKIDAERCREYLNSILSSGRHLLDIINDVLDLARVEAGKMVLAEGDVDLAQVVRSCIRLVAGNAEENGIALITDLPGSIPVLIGDRRKVKQILINLLSNALKFTPSGGKVTVAVRIEAGGELALSVRDTGEGIPAESLNSVLHPFSQVESGLNRRHDGAGLGLPLTKAMAELHDGSLQIESALSKGTTVTVRFPAGRLEPATVPPPATCPRGAGRCFAGPAACTLQSRQAPAVKQP